MSSSSHDTEIAAPIQGVSWNVGMLEWAKTGKACSSDYPAIGKSRLSSADAWQRVRKLAQVTDLLRALLVYAACGYSFRQLGLWATLVGVGCLSERAWCKRVAWCRWRSQIATTPRDCIILPCAKGM